MSKKNQEHVQRLEDLGSIASESTYADWFIDHAENPDQEHVVEPLKAVPRVDLETCYVRVSCKAAHVEKPKLKDQKILTPREMKINLPQHPNLFPGKIDFLKHKKESVLFFFFKISLTHHRASQEKN